MKVTEEYKTYGKPRSVRLKGFDYKLPYAYLVTILCKNRQKFFEKDKLSEAILKGVRDLKVKGQVKIHAFCIMPDHVHLILSPSGTLGIPGIIRLFKGNATKTFYSFGFTGTLWQKSYHEHILRKAENLKEAVKYVLDNPVRANLVNNHDDYKFCGVIDEIEM